MSIVGRTYLLAGAPVKVLIQWATGQGRVGPRNVLIEFPDGRRTTRPFRGLRKLPPGGSGE